MNPGNESIEFEDWMIENFRPKTIENTMRALRYLERNGVDLGDRNTFREWVRNSRRKGILDRTINTYIKTYNRVLAWKGDTRIKFFKEQHSLNRPVASQDDYSSLIRAARSYGYTRERKELIVEILFKTGARLRELSELTLDAFQGDTAKVIGKGQKEAKLFIMPSVRDSLNRYLKVRTTKGTSKLFTNQAGNPMTYDGIRQEIYQISKKAGISFSAHRARRFFARYLYRSGVDLEGIRILMRHTKFDTTKEYIQMAMDDALEHVRKKDLDFKESRIGVNPYGIKRPGREWFSLEQILLDRLEGTICSTLLSVL